MQAPGVCFICETAPQAGYVDTLHTFVPGFPHALAGPIAICDNCVKTAAESAGFYADDTVKESAKQARVAEGKLQHVVAHVQEVVKGLAEEFLLNDVASQAPVAVAEASAEVEAAEAAAAAKPKKAKAVKAEATDAPADAEPFSE